MKLTTETLRQVIINEIKSLLNEDNVEKLFDDYQSLKLEYDVAKFENNYEKMNEISEDLQNLGIDVLTVMHKDDPRGDEIDNFIFTELDV
jgi:predicted component of type VI protein secretion system